jgi:hypothetical protein
MYEMFLKISMTESMCYLVGTGALCLGVERREPDRNNLSPSSDECNKKRGVLLPQEGQGWQQYVIQYVGGGIAQLYGG